MKSEERGYPYPYSYPPAPPQEGSPYGTFQGPPPPPPFGYYPPQDGHHHHHHHHQHGSTTQGYPVAQATHLDIIDYRLPCCGIGFGWFLFILGFFLASIPWYAGAFSLLCFRHDPRERPGLICCAVAAAISLTVALIGTGNTRIWG